MNNRHFAVCGAVFISGKVMLVRHTYGKAKDRLLLPGGFVKENELPTAAAEREIFEETSVRAKAESIISVQFKPDQWCIVFLMDYIDGTPESDHYENSEVVLLTLEDALKRDDMTNMSRAILAALHEKRYAELAESGYCATDSTPENYRIFGI